MKSHFVAFFCSMVWCLSQAEERLFMESRGHLILNSHRFNDPVLHILGSNTRDAVPVQDDGSRKNSAYYNFIKNDQDDNESKFEPEIHILSRSQEALRMTDGQYKPLRDLFLRQLELKDARISEERSDIEKGMDNDNNENIKSDKLLSKLAKDSITAWPIHMSPERKMSLLGKSIWKKKNHASEHHGVGENKNSENIFNSTEISAPVNTSTENTAMITDSIHNVNISLNITDSTEDLKITEMSTVESTQEPYLMNKAYVETKEANSEQSTSKTSFSKSTIYKSNLSDIDADIKVVNDSTVAEDEEDTRSKSGNNVEMLSSPLEKEPIHLGNEPLHQSYLYKSLDFKPVKFFPSAERDFIVPNGEAVKENQHRKESPQMSFRMPIKESAGPDLFPSSVFEDEIKIPFFYIDS